MKTRSAFSKSKFLSMSISVLILLTAFGRVSAKDVSLGKISAADLKAQCEAEGGTFTITPDGENWICTKRCGSSFCLVICDIEGGCSGHTPGKPAENRPVNHTVSEVLNGKIKDGSGSLRPWLFPVFFILVILGGYWILSKRRS
jgi:hypothetical protein